MCIRDSTYTGPGHASIYTGTTPAVHGIVANDWYDKNSGKHIYCAGDGDMHTICNCEDNNIDVQSEDGKMSPQHMLTTTFADELKLFYENSKVYGVSLKDRGAILPYPDNQVSRRRKMIYLLSLTD